MKQIKLKRQFFISNFLDDIVIAINEYQIGEDQINSLGKYKACNLRKTSASTEK